MTRTDVDTMIENTIGSDDDFDQFDLAREMHRKLSHEQFCEFMVHLTSILSDQ